MLDANGQRNCGSRFPTSRFGDFCALLASQLGEHKYLCLSKLSFNWKLGLNRQVVPCHSHLGGIWLSQAETIEGKAMLPKAPACAKEIGFKSQKGWMSQKDQDLGLLGDNLGTPLGLFLDYHSFAERLL